MEDDAAAGAGGGDERPATARRKRDEDLAASVVRDRAAAGEAEPHAPSDALAEELKQFVKTRIAPYKYPRWIEFVDELPKTATGKIQRFKLRERDGT